MPHHGEAGWWRPGVAVQDGEREDHAAETASDAAGSPVPFWALLGFTFVLLLAPQNFFPVLASFRIALLTAVIAVGTYLLDRLRRRQPIMPLTKETRIAACLLGWAFVTVPFSYWPGGSLSFLLGDYVKTLAIFWLLSNVMNTHARLRHITWGLTLMAFPLTVTAVHHFLSGEFIPEGMNYGATRILGYDAPLTANPNDLALLLNLILPLSVALFLSSRRSLVRLLLLALLALDVSAIVLTYSRAGFLTLATTLVLFAAKRWRRQELGWAWMAFVIVLACVPLLPSSYVDRLSTIADMKSDSTGSSQERWRDAVAAMNHVLAHPVLGAGAGMNMLALNEVRGASWKEVHNVYLEYAVDLGIPGLVLFLLLFGGCVRTVRLVRQRCDGVDALRELFYLAEGIQTSLIAFAIAALFHPVAYHSFFYYIAGLALATRTAYESESSDAPRHQNRSSAHVPAAADYGRFERLLSHREGKT